MQISTTTRVSLTSVRMATIKKSTDNVGRFEAGHSLKFFFLVFLTGTDRIQVRGLKNMKITFCCPENMNEKDPIRAQTCFSVLYLPKYSTMERVEEALQVAISNHRGFG